MTTELFQAMQAAQAAFNAADAAGDNAQALALLAPLEAAERAYYAAEGKAQAEWDALPEGRRKDSAWTNADDTVTENGAQGDRLYWLQMAVASFEFAEG